MDHGFHWTAESHNLDMINLEQVLHCCLHPEEGCGGPVGLHMTIRWPGEDHLDVQDWMSEHGPNEPLPASFELPAEFTLTLPPLENPPDLLGTWIELLKRFEGSLLRVEVSGSDRIEPPRRDMEITASSQIPLRLLLAAEGDDTDDDGYPICEMIDSLRDLCLSISKNVEQWGPTDPRH